MQVFNKYIRVRSSGVYYLRVELDPVEPKLLVVYGGHDVRVRARRRLQTLAHALHAVSVCQQHCLTGLQTTAIITNHKI